MNDYSLLKDFLIDRSISTVLIILISINILLIIGDFISKLLLSNKDKYNKKKLIIDEKSIKVLEQLFHSLDSLSLLDKSESDLMLNKIRETNQFITSNKLYISKHFQNISNDILDYYKNVLVDFRNKDIKTEITLYERFCNEFNK